MKQLYFDPAFKVNYSSNYPHLTQYPFKLILRRGLRSVLSGPKLFYIIPKHIDKSFEKVVELKQKTINEKPIKRGKKSVENTNNNKKRKSNIRISQF